METTVVRVTKPTWKTLKQLSRVAHQSMQATLEEAIELYRRQKFFEELNASARSLQANPKAWQEELEERKAWDAVIQDGLEKESRSILRKGKKLG